MGCGGMTYNPGGDANAGANTAFGWAPAPPPPPAEMGFVEAPSLDVPLLTEAPPAAGAALAALGDLAMLMFPTPTAPPSLDQPPASTYLVPQYQPPDQPIDLPPAIASPAVIQPSVQLPEPDTTITITADAPLQPPPPIFPPVMMDPLMPPDWNALSTPDYPFSVNAPRAPWWLGLGGVLSKFVDLVTRPGTLGDTNVGDRTAGSPAGAPDVTGLPFPGVAIAGLAGTPLQDPRPARAPSPVVSPQPAPARISQPAPAPGRAPAKVPAPFPTPLPLPIATPAPLPLPKPQPVRTRTPTGDAPVGVAPSRGPVQARIPKVVPTPIENPVTEPLPKAATQPCPPATRTKQKSQQKKPRQVCHSGTYVEHSRGLSKRPQRTIPCR